MSNVIAMKVTYNILPFNIRQIFIPLNQKIENNKENKIEKDKYSIFKDAELNEENILERHSYHVPRRTFE